MNADDAGRGITVEHERVVDAPTMESGEPPKPAAKPERRSEVADRSPRDADGLSELDKHRIERGQKKDPRTPERLAEVAKEAKAGKPAGDGADGDGVDKTRRPVHSDPDAEFDARTRAGRRILELKGNEKSYKARISDQDRRIAELERQLSTRGNPDQIPRSTDDPKLKASDRSSGVPSEADDPEPQDADFASWADYSRALAKWEARQEVRREREAARTADERQRAESQQQERLVKFGQQFDAARQRHADFDAMLERIPMTEAFQHIREAVLDHEHGAEMAYYLASTPEVVRGLFQVKSLAEHIRRIRDVELVIEKRMGGQGEPVKRAATTRAPAPTTSVQSHAATRQSQPLTGDMDVQEYRARRGFGASVNGGR